MSFIEVLMIILALIIALWLIASLVRSHKG